MAQINIDTRKKISVEEYLRDYAHKRYEYVDGYAVPMGEEIEINGELQVSPTRAEHGLIVDEIQFHISAFARQNNLGRIFGAETGFVMQESPFRMRAADVAFIAQARLKEIKRDEWIPFAPDLAVEVVSEHDRAAEIRKKAHAYLASGTRLLWIIYPDTREVEVYQPDQPMRLLTVADTLDGSAVLPGFSLRLEALFAPLDSLSD